MRHGEDMQSEFWWQFFRAEKIVCGHAMVRSRKFWF
jgi:hypothetical protein